MINIINLCEKSRASNVSENKKKLNKGDEAGFRTSRYHIISLNKTKIKFT